MNSLQYMSTLGIYLIGCQGGVIGHGMCFSHGFRLTGVVFYASAFSNRFI